MSLADLSGSDGTGVSETVEIAADRAQASRFGMRIFICATEGVNHCSLLLGDEISVWVKSCGVQVRGLDDDRKLLRFKK